MSMYKPPSKRVRCPPPIRVGKPSKGTFLYNILNSAPTTHFTFKKQPIYHQDRYLKALERNHKNLGIPYVKPELPEATSYQEPHHVKEPELIYGDRIQVNMRILKSGIVRIKVNCAIAMMYEKYYRQGVHPPFKTILQAYKSHGFSEEFLERIKVSHDKKLIFAKKVPKILEKIFEKEPVKKVKKKKDEEKTEEIDDEPEAEVEEDEIPADEGELDVEPDEEEVVEEYVSDGDE